MSDPRSPSPQQGYNNNVRHRGLLFHIQTEDSGVRRPHVTTHLFADGGRIVHSLREEYREHLGNERVPETVRAMMRDQHKAMFIALRSGAHDSAIAEICGPLSGVAADEARAEHLPTAGDAVAASPAPCPSESAPAAARS